MLLQEFDCVIKDRKGFKNPVDDHLSKIMISDVFEFPICDCFPDEQLFIVNFLVSREMLKGVE